MENIPKIIEDYIFKSLKELIKVEGEIIKTSSYGGSLNIKFKSNKNYRLSIELKTGEVTLDEVLNTSEEWSKIHNGIIIYDPDGWDRSNYDYSWFEELITEKEYMDRVCRSTCLRTK